MAPGPEQPSKLSKEQKKQHRKEQKLAWKHGHVAAARLVDAMIAGGNLDVAKRPEGCPEPVRQAASALAKRIFRDVDAQRALRLGARASDAPAEGDNGDADGGQPPRPNNDLSVAVKIITRVLQVGL